MEYTVNFILSHDGTRVLLQHKDRTAYAGRYNGVGGKIEMHESPEQSSLREVREETGLAAGDFEKGPAYLGKLDLPDNCADPGLKKCVLYYFGYVARDIGAARQQPGETEPLETFPVDEVLREPVNGYRFAGDGDLQMFVNKARLVLGFQDGT